MTEEVTTPEVQEDADKELEMVLFAVAIVAAILLGYRNKAKIKTWFDDLIGKIK